MSKEPITFHYVKPNEMLGLHDLLILNKPINECKEFKKLKGDKQEPIVKYAKILIEQAPKPLDFRRENKQIDQSSNLIQRQKQQQDNVM